jgi:hypothetical protein
MSWSPSLSPGPGLTVVGLSRHPICVVGPQDAIAGWVEESTHPGAVADETQKVAWVEVIHKLESPWDPIVEHPLLAPSLACCNQEAQ